MRAVCNATQVVGYGVALLCALIDGIVCGIGIASVVAIGHPAMSRLSTALISLHQQTMSVEEQKALALRGEVAGLQAAPVAWRVISRACAAGYVSLCSLAIWYFAMND
jgi:hypothetical protein